MRNPVVLRESKTPVFRPLLLTLAGLAILGGVVNGLTGPPPYPWGEIAFGLLSATYFLLSGTLHRRPFGEVRIAQERLFLGGWGETLSIELHRLNRIVCHRRQLGDDDDASSVWEIEAVFEDGARILLHEAFTPEDALPFLRDFGSASQVETVESLDAWVPHPGGFRGEARTTLQTLGTDAPFWTRVAGGSALTWVGLTILFMGNGIQAFFAGPPVTLLGIVVVLFALGERIGKRQLSRSETQWDTAFMCGGMRLFARQERDSGAGLLRVVSRGNRGWFLEWANGTRTFPISTGYTLSGTPDNVTTLLQTSASFNGALEPNAHPPA